MENKRRCMKVAITVLFIVAVYFVEAGPWGSMSVGRYNGGYGTFDMKTYDVVTVYRVLSQFIVGGLAVVNKYYFCDYIFIIALLAFQLMLSQLVYKNVKSAIPRLLLNGAAVIRALADVIENTLLLYIINVYPVQHDPLITIASIFTSIKLYFFPIWGGLLLIGILFNFVKLNKS